MLNRCYIKLSLVNILENIFVFIEILFKMLLFKGGVLIYAEHCRCNIHVGSAVSYFIALHKVFVTAPDLFVH